MLSVLLGVALSVLSLAGCTFDYSAATVGGGDAQPLPQVELQNVTMVIERTNRLELTAQRIASFPREGYQTFEELSFREFAPDGELRLEGSAEHGTLSFETENIELEGSVRFRSLIEDATLTSEFLLWNQDARELTGTREGTVTVERSDGSRIEGSGFRVDGRRNELEFTGGVRGTYQPSGEERP